MGLAYKVVQGEAFEDYIVGVVQVAGKDVPVSLYRDWRAWGIHLVVPNMPVQNVSMFVGNVAWDETDLLVIEEEVVHRLTTIMLLLTQPQEG